MPTYTHPGEFNQLIDLSQVPVLSTGVNGGTVFVSTQGPTTPQLVGNATQFTQVYGNPNAAVSFAHYQVLQMLRQAPVWCVRAVHADATYGGLMFGEVGSTSFNLVPENVTTPSAQLLADTPIAPTLANLAYFFLQGPGTMVTTVWQSASPPRTCCP